MTTSQPKRQPIPFGKYLLLDRINIGGMAEVWRGKTFGAGGFERLVAIKRILPNIAEDDEFISMFIDEAKISVQLAHANIAQIYELGHISNSYFIAMEYIPGKDMRAIFDRCRKKGEPAPIPLVAYTVAKMCEGLDYAHRKKDGMGRDLNIVHRDISPQNVLISFEGEVKVIDFGIAKAAGKATKTQAGILKGKFGYMSPEQIRGLPLDRRSDVFAIGVCLYEMLTGERLFVGDSDFSVLEKVRKAEVAPPSTYNRRIPEQLEKIVLKALTKDVDERYQYASELGDDLQRFLITNDAIFGRKDLMQYMKSTFAEDVEREKQRLAEYAGIKPPEGMLAAIEAGFSGTSPMPSAAPPPQPVAPPIQTPMELPKAAGATAVMGPPGAGGEAIRRTPSLTALPKLTAAAAAPPPKDDEGVATMLVDSREYFDDEDEPTTQPGARPGRAVTPLESERAELGDGEPAGTGKTAVIGPPPGSQGPRLSSGNIPVVTPTPNVQIRPSVFGMPAVPPQEAGISPARPPPGRYPGEGLPRIARSEGPGGGPPILSPGGASAYPGPASRPPPHLPSATPPPGPAAKAPPAPREENAPGQLFGQNRNVVFGAIGGVALLMLGLILFLVLRSPATGFIVVQLPQELKGKARVTINSQPATVSEGFVLQTIAAGPVAVVVSADGYDTFSQVVTIQPSQQTTVVPTMASQVKTVSMVLATVPQDAQVMLNGKVVRAQGAQDSFIRDLPASEEMAIEVRAPGYRTFQQKYAPPKGAEPLQVTVRLEQAEVAVRVESEPAGATILASGKELGAVTPATVKLPAGVKQVTLRLRCFEETDVPVSPSSSGESPAVAKGSLKKQPGCK
ncbi:serine/threonine protein kinase [Hyalangium versicolor]|uniref:serine/threonine protein kinase n=1 Tax=Hyalangium versicolor TaxID=2861190 RepID=UPI001CCE82E4|nr:serine/threonine-protein kinase [Hyalangium versicolor]